MLYSTRTALEGMIEKAERLSRTPRLKENDTLEIEWSPPELPELRGPNQLGIDITIRTARDLIDDAAPSSLASFRRQIADDPDVSDACKRDCARLGKRLRDSLDQPPKIRIRGRGQSPPTQWDLLQALLFGDLERIDAKKRDTVRAWLGQPTTALVLRAQVQTALIRVCDALVDLKQICDRELQRAAR